MNLVVVESPAKARTISKFLGKGYEVVASYGHVRDLPVHRFGVDIEHGFKPKYEVPREKKPIVEHIRELAKHSNSIYIATDEDREGEAIGWHITRLLRRKEEDVKRIVFHEVTKKALEKAINNPRTINLNMVDSQEARRILDRIVGYKLSPLLSKKIKRGLSAGRVQSVAAKLVVEREKEITSFVRKEYWTIHLLTEEGIEALLTHIDGTKIDKTFIKSKKEALQLKKRIEKEEFSIESVTRKKTRKNPEPPFITSTLQMTASNILNFSPKKTMMLAQKLYEGIDIGKTRMGIITYMRTDSFNVSEEAQTSTLNLISNLFGGEYAPEKPNVYKTKSKLAQEAHECIRPVDVKLLPEMAKPYLTEEEYKLYNLIWRRFIASQMTQAVVRNTSIVLSSLSFKAKASFNEIEFDGFTRVWERSGLKESPSPEGLKKGNRVVINSITPKQHFTEPPPRYTPATLIKALESHGIGRPSTYATIIDTILARGYVSLKDGKFYPNDIGIVVTEELERFFSDIINVKFTARMEDKLDKIVEGNLSKLDVLSEFYEKFRTLLETAEQEMENRKPKPQETDIICELCGAPMVIREGKFGKFLACSNYPKCKNTKSLVEQKTDIICELCGAPMVIKHSKTGARFLACSNYPKCKNTKPYPTGLKCPECGRDLVEKSSKRGTFYGCSGYPQCTFTIRGEIKNKTCPLCGYTLMVKKKTQWHCARKGCNYREEEGAP